MRMSRSTLALAVLVSASLVACRGKDASTVKGAELEAAAVPDECEGFRDAPADKDPLEWLKHNSNQKALEKIFLCAPGATVVPTGLGIGRGTLYQAWPLWNDIQTKLGTYIWGGKRLYAQPDGEVCLLNQMADLKKERYKAHVYLTPSNRDAKNVVVLDYRVDDTKGLTISPVQIIIDKIAKGIRDEIREITQNGVGTGVYVGRANLHKNVFVAKSLQGITDAEFADPTKYVFGANFFLDFRPDSSVQAYGTETPTCFGAAPAAQ